MSSNLLESIGLGWLDLAYVLIGMIVFLILLLILIIVQFSKIGKLQKKYENFMRGKDANSLEEDIVELFKDNDFVKTQEEQNRIEIKSLKKRMECCYQKVGIVKYDAFQQMGGQLSFCIVLMDAKNNGFILNSVHSTEGCYTYTKEIIKGECSLTLGEEEKKALDQALGL